MLSGKETQTTQHTNAIAGNPATTSRSLPARPVLQPVVQLKPATFTLPLAVKALNANSAEKKSVDIDFDDEVGLKVGAIRQLLEKYKGGLYKVAIHFLGTNVQLNTNLKNDDYLIAPPYLKTGTQLLAVLEEMPSKEELEKKVKEKKPRPSKVMKLSELKQLISKYSIQKIVTANHINNAGKPGATEENSAVTEQQVNQVSGNTLFIDPFYLAPGQESQYHDIIIKNGGAIVEKDSTLSLCVVTNKEKTFLLLVLSRFVYTDEVDELGVTTKHYIHETRPDDIIKE